MGTKVIAQATSWVCGQTQVRLGYPSNGLHPSRNAVLGKVVSLLAHQGKISLRSPRKVEKWPESLARISESKKKNKGATWVIKLN